MLTALIATALVAASPTQVVKTGNDEIQKVLKSSDATVAKLAEKADQFVDFVELAKRALGEQWGKLNRKQQEEFSQTMKGLLRASYAQKAIADSKGEAPEVIYGEESAQGNDAEVPTTLALKKDKVPVVYRLYRSGAGREWKIYDVVTDEVSLVQTYRDQFRKLIDTKGFDGLLATLKAKRAQLEKAPASN